MDRSEYVISSSGDDLRQAEKRILADKPTGFLMDRAAARLAVVCADLLQEATGRIYGSRVVMLIGPGHNGGDALLAGAILRRRGVAVDALAVGDGVHARGLRKFQESNGRLVEVRDGESSRAAKQLLQRADLVLDGIVGLSGHPGLEDHALALVEAIPSRALVVAVDLPSGVDPQTGETPAAHVVADVTVAFGTIHPCLLLPPASHAAGRVIFADVGMQSKIDAEPVVRRLTERGAALRWPVPAHTAHKYSRGLLGVVAGSDRYPGAAVLAVAGAIRAGVGVVRYVGPSHVTAQVLSARPEAVPGMGRVQAWLLGSGVEDDPVQDKAIATALASGLPCVVDAGALDACVRERASGSRAAPATSILLTPHAGELARMLVLLGHEVTREAVEAQPLRHVRWLAIEADATVLLKGPTTLVAGPAGPVFSQADGVSWMATAGSGDVLAGIAGALMATGVDAPHAGAMAALVHGRAGAAGSNGGPLAAMEMADATPAVVAALLDLLQEPKRHRRR
ncbi:NAD(P)H-hydrate dehydratase [Actinoplanes sp. NPDC049802]|uniref:bifunctional ADP-dependent NAD(P)H-hydrate dehydratase/NAD(P)H-hydrate epimerase n=1 Tax=Actinoplanes sp. NPDC049802 TaxID=3154742 RepID=UPI0033F55856